MVVYVVEPDSIFISGEAAPDDHVWVRADIRAGRTREQKAAILHQIMQETGEILGISRENVWVYVSDIPAGRRRSVAGVTAGQVVGEADRRFLIGPTTSVIAIETRPAATDRKRDGGSGWFSAGLLMGGDG